MRNVDSVNPFLDITANFTEEKNQRYIKTINKRKTALSIPMTPYLCTLLGDGPLWMM